MISLQGRNANIAGQSLENKISEIIEEYNIPTIKFSKFRNMLPINVALSFPIGVVVTDKPYINMYGCKAKGDLTLYLRGQAPIRIECRSQTQKGSVDDKFPKLLGDCVCMDEKNIFIVIDGHGAKKEAVNWLINSAVAVKHKNISVVRPDVFKNVIKTFIKNTNVYNEA